MINHKELSIIIVNYNGAQYLEACMDSIKKCCKGIDYEIIMVDNNSSDNSLDIIKRKYAEEVCLIESKENLGFGKGNNLAVSNSNAKCLLLLNNDTILLDNLKPALDLLEDESIGAVGIKMLGKTKEYRPSTGHFPSPLRLLKLSWLTYKKEKFQKGERLYEVDWIEGSFLLTKRLLWDDFEGFDDRFFMYVEDVDLCKEIAEREKRRIYFPELKYIHFGGFNSQREHLLIKGHRMFVNKHFHGLYRKMCLWTLGINEAYKMKVKRING
ncbi:MAG: glycosyltransferase family 2 protein [Allomuricauda sp.]